MGTAKDNEMKLALYLRERKKITGKPVVCVRDGKLFWMEKTPYKSNPLFKDELKNNELNDKTI